ncbi:MAG: L-aspartate oxidase [Salegentibacter sp.]
MKKSDVLIVGSGIAGLSFAIKIAQARPDLSVLVLTKSNNESSNTAHAQGGIAVVLDKVKDSFEQHIQDTMQAGKGLSDPKVVEMVVSQAPERLQELISWGTSFDADKKGDLDLGLEGGHSRHRIVHHQDFTGLELERKLLAKAAELDNICFHDHYFAIDLLTEQNNTGITCTGVKAINKFENRLVKIPARVCFLATGGSGMLFKNTTNPSVATADGVAMAYRAGAEIRNMNYIQFHPTALYEKDENPLFLISEAVRGYGAYVVNSAGKRFLFDFDSRGELATRDIVSGAIVTEMKRTGADCAYLDCRHLEHEAFAAHFPTIDSYCYSLGINLQTDLIPVVPAAHYQCGGIQVDEYSHTTVKNLYASGECANTGLHGANRLASNSLLEAVVFSHQASEAVLAEIDSLPPARGFEEFKLDNDLTGRIDPYLDNCRKYLNALMTYDLVHASSPKQKEKALLELQRLNRALEEDSDFPGNTPRYFELLNMVQASMLVLEQALPAKDISLAFPDAVNS